MGSSTSKRQLRLCEVKHAMAVELRAPLGDETTPVPPERMALAALEIFRRCRSLSPHSGEVIFYSVKNFGDLLGDLSPRLDPDFAAWLSDSLQRRKVIHEYYQDLASATRACEKQTEITLRMIPSLAVAGLPDGTPLDILTISRVAAVALTAARKVLAEQHSPADPAEAIKIAAHALTLAIADRGLAGVAASALATDLQLMTFIQEVWGTLHRTAIK